MDISELPQIIKMFFALIIIISVTTEIGFLIQKAYVDIRAVLISTTISVLVGIIIMSYNLVGGFIISFICLNLALSYIGEVSVLPDTLFASVVGTGIEVYLVINYFGTIFLIK